MSSILPRLLIVDDEMAHVTALVRMLKREGYAPIGAHSAAEALSALRSSHFDILITDLEMPGMEGLALLHAAQALDRNLVSVVMTGQGSMDTAIGAMKGGALDYILKPFNLGTIVPVLSRAVAMRRLRAENAALVERVAKRGAELEAANRVLRDASRALGALSAKMSQRLSRPLQELSEQSFLLLGEAKTLTPMQRRVVEGLAQRARDLAGEAGELLREFGILQQ